MISFLIFGNNTIYYLPSCLPSRRTLETQNYLITVANPIRLPVTTVNSQLSTLNLKYGS